MTDNNYQYYVKLPGRLFFERYNQAEANLDSYNKVYDYPESNFDWAEMSKYFIAPQALLISSFKGFIYLAFDYNGITTNFRGELISLN